MPYAASSNIIQKTVKKDSFFYIRTHYKDLDIIRIKEDKLLETYHDGNNQDRDEDKDFNAIILAI